MTIEEIQEKGRETIGHQYLSTFDEEMQRKIIFGFVQGFLQGEIHQIRKQIEQRAATLEGRLAANMKDELCK